ncbi:NTP transferase domain-containing protein [Alteribacter populi]|uniref:NTP transferase domain-containing protein n=1 Tax=Alteribacter populi TaxID=2011011 RepID=UPI0012FE7A89|nr:NTP transferase domain-containing protein [Alteribacter populi]
MIVGIYLAAGHSERMGCHKLSLSLGNKPLGSVALETAILSVLDRTIVVTREEDSLNWLPSELFLDPYRKKWKHQRCKESVRGQAESLKCGLKAAKDMQAKAVMVLLADQPFVTKKIINHIVFLYKTEKPSHISSCYKGVLRPPVLFDSTVFPALFQLHGDEGARRILRNDITGITVEFNTEKPFLDADTPDQFKVLIEQLE